MEELENGSLGFALVCDFDGVINEIIWDDYGLDNAVAGLTHFVALFDPCSEQKGLALFLYVKEHGVAMGWEINIRIHDELQLFCFTAATVGDKLIIVGSAALLGVYQICEGMSHMLNEQFNNFRSLYKESIHAVPGQQEEKPAEQDKLSREIITDMLELNNRLVNAERQLARKTAELRRMTAVLSKDLHLAHRVLQCSGEAIIIADRNRKVLEVNSSFIAISGFSKQEVIGQPLLLVEPGYHAPGFVDEIWDTVLSRGVWQGECFGRRKCGDLFPKWQAVSTVFEENQVVSHFVIIFSDISRLKQAEEKWQQLAFYDALTGLPNRVLYRDRLAQSLIKAKREHTSLTLLYLDLDDFKLINDSLGHDAGDKLLCEAAKRIVESVRESDTISRLGGDEFSAIVHGCEDEDAINQLCNKIIAGLNTPFFINGNCIHIGVSIGVARYPADGEDIDTLTKNADAAMYAVKANGRNNSFLFNKALGDKISLHLDIKSQISRGLQKNEFCLYFQPEIDLESGKIKSLEALVRWHQPERGIVLPDEFIGIAEDTGLIIELGEFVIREAVRLIGVLQKEGWSDIRVAVNVSRRQLVSPHFTKFIVNQLQQNQVEGHALIIEITESMVIGNLENAIRVLNELKGYGIDTAIDDFGTGYSSLNYLRRLPVEFIKIDKSFVADAEIVSESKTIIRAISAMAKSLGLKTIAEGVETKAQEAMLKMIGCEIGQGYLYAKPLRFDDLLAFLKSH
ncbi:EAL domain-containing protein [Methylicorpusculum oleiharenae]|uniref:putative bifunctional diguanylate cyclase/phosphodiesterase n=1 Tax=Methylicorpusculum oleiharenae TaxID=1338687 RepID=UPI00135BAFD7|nr:EAL domain-containing protein [Methylicorpusculum oleiharenae]MCD2452330.1 EAL domain-containing protein [Methylicorpusculum oleiharenae]